MPTVPLPIVILGKQSNDELSLPIVLGISGLALLAICGLSLIAYLFFKK